MVSILVLATAAAAIKTITATVGKKAEDEKKAGGRFTATLWLAFLATQALWGPESLDLLGGYQLLIGLGALFGLGIAAKLAIELKYLVKPERRQETIREASLPIFEKPDHEAEYQRILAKADAMTKIAAAEAAKLRSEDAIGEQFSALGAAVQQEG